MIFWLYLAGKWEKVTAFCRQPEYTVMGLQEGHKYNFRVVAENELGNSNPLYTDKPITAKHDFSEFFSCIFSYVKGKLHKLSFLVPVSLLVQMCYCFIMSSTVFMY